MLDDDLDALSQRTRVAVAAACVEHVVDFYRKGNFSFKVRQAKGAKLDAPPDNDLVEYAIQLAWRFAEKGRLQAALVDAVLAGFRDDSTDDEDMCLGGKSTLLAVASLMRAIGDETPAQAVRAIEDSAFALDDALTSNLVSGAEVKKAVKDEEAWQAKVLQRARELGEKAPKRGAFADLVSEELPWRAHLDHYGIIRVPS